MSKKITCVLLALLMVVSVMCVCVPEAQAATKRTKSRDIAIVFDNSGSMYSNSYTGERFDSWCRATYAMEVFASMLNEGDRLMIYPMWEITLGVNGSERYSMKRPLIIDGPGEADRIRQIYTPSASTTPFSTAHKAFAGLRNDSTADEKYLIVLTDGLFDEGEAAVQSGMEEFSKVFNTMFLGIGDVYVPEVTDPSRQYFDKASSSDQVLSKLTVMCNRIFGRDTLEVSGDKVDFDVSMSKLILFVQGEGITDVSLSGGTKVSEHPMKYSELGAGGRGEPLVDRTLQGMIVTYEDIPAGGYTIGHKGSATSVSVYYEPDVDLQIRLIDEGGNVVDPGSGEIFAGSYTLEYGLVDADGVPTTSKLLGDVQYDITYTVNGQPTEIHENKGGHVQIDLPAGSTLDGTFKAVYLGDYTIEKDSEALGWPRGGLNIALEPVKDFLLEVTGGQQDYPLTQLEALATYKVTLRYDGELLTGEALDAVTFPDPVLEGGNAKVRVERVEDGFTVSLHHQGDVADTTCGEQKLTFRASYTNKDAQTGDAPAVTKTFTVSDDSKALGIRLELGQSYYVIKDLPESKPIIVHLTMGGAPLTAEEFEGAELDFRIPGLTYDIQPDPAGSRYVVALKNEGDIDTGKYEVSCAVTGTDTLGRPCSAQDGGEIELQHYPLWVRILAIVLLIALIVLLIWLWSNMKSMPKHITAVNGSFLAGGKQIPGAISCKYVRNGRKRGSLTITSPKVIADPSLRCGMTLELEADSPRRVPSARRKVRVVGITPASKKDTTRMQVGGTTMTQNSQGQFVRLGTANDTKIDCGAGSGTVLGVAATVLSAVRGRKVAVSISSLRLKFR